MSRMETRSSRLPAGSSLNHRKPEVVQAAHENQVTASLEIAAKAHAGCSCLHQASGLQTCECLVHPVITLTDFDHHPDQSEVAIQPDGIETRDLILLILSESNGR